MSKTFIPKLYNDSLHFHPPHNGCYEIFTHTPSLGLSLLENCIGFWLIRLYYISLTNSGFSYITCLYIGAQWLVGLALALCSIWFSLDESKALHCYAIITSCPQGCLSNVNVSRLFLSKIRLWKNVTWTMRKKKTTNVDGIGGKWESISLIHPCKEFIKNLLKKNPFSMGLS